MEAAGPFVGRVVEILRDGVERGEVRDDIQVERLALLFSGLCELTVSIHWGAGGGWPALDDIPGLVTTLFLDGAAERGDAMSGLR